MSRANGIIFTQRDFVYLSFQAQLRAQAPAELLAPYPAWHIQIYMATNCLYFVISFLSSPTLSLCLFRF